MEGISGRQERQEKSLKIILDFSPTRIKNVFSNKEGHKAMKEIDDLAKTRRREMGRRNLSKYENPSLWAWIVGIIKRLLGVN